MILTNTGNTDRLINRRRGPGTATGAATGRNTDPLTDGRPNPQALRLRVQRPEPGIVVVRMSGEVDLSSVPRLTELIRQRLTAAVLRALVLDLSDVSFFSSAGLELLLHAQQRSEYRSIPMYLVPGTGVAARLLGLTGLTEAFTVRDDAAQAVAELRGER